MSPKPDPNHPLYGLYWFKTDFDGEIYHILGCWDYPFDEKVFKSLTFSEMRSKGYPIN